MKNQRCISVNNLKLHIILDEKFIYGIHWKKQDVQAYELSKMQAKLLLKLENELVDYFCRDLKKFKTPIKLEGTEFQLKVWSELKNIPYAKLMTYKELAVKVGNPNASRAVGSANSKNPISIIVPCHRVIRSGGEYGGYAGGQLLKHHLISRELGLS